MECAIHRVLGGEAAGHVRAAGVASDTIRLLVDSPAWASIARFKGPEIRAALRSDSPRIRHVRIIVQEIEAPLGPPPLGPPPREAPRAISPCVARALRSTARSIDNPRLARILVRLASREPPAANHEVRERDAVTGSQSAATGRP